MHSDIQYQNRAYSKSNPIRLCTTHLISYCDALSFYCSSRWKSLDGWTWFSGSVGSPWHTRLCRVPSSWRASVRPSDRNGGNTWCGANSRWQGNYLHRSTPLHSMKGNHASPLFQCRNHRYGRMNHTGQKMNYKYTSGHLCGANWVKNLFDNQFEFWHQ